MRLSTFRRRVALAATGLMVVALGAAIAAPAHAAVACQVTYTKAWDNGSGFGANLTLLNQGDPWTSWTLTYTWPGNQTGIQGWSANYSQSGQNVTATSLSYNGAVANGGSVGIGFNASYSGTNTDPTSFKVNGTTCGGTQPTVNLVVSPTAVSVPEGGTATYAVRLSAQPSGNVTVTTAAGSGDTDLTVSSGASLTFTTSNWNTNQNVTLAAAEDADTTNGTRPFTVAATGLTSVTVNATEADNDTTTTQSLVVSPTSVSVPEGSTAAFGVRLAVQPAGNVTVTTAAGSGDTNLTVSSGASLTFTTSNWNTVQNVTLAAAEDADTTNGTRPFTVASSGLTSVTVNATEADNDTTTTQSLVVSPTSVSVPEGSTAVVGVHLAVQPTGNVTVTTAAGSGDTDLTVSSGASLTFTTSNWATNQNVTLAAAQDADSTNGTRPFTVASSGLTSVTVTATEVDDENTANAYITEFTTQYNKLKDPANGYFSQEGIPYHTIETLLVEAPDHGHETTSEAFSFWIWLEAQYGRVTKNWTPFNNAWTTMETYIIPSAAAQPGQSTYNPSDPADYAPEALQPNGYPVPLSTSVVAGQDPLANELQTTYGNRNIYGMHWLLDVDDVYKYGTGRTAAECGDSTQRVTYINTFQRGPQESTWETVAHPSCDTGRFANFPSLFIQGSGTGQWRYTDAPDADARAVEAAYWALQWATAQGNQSQISATVSKAAKMGDFLRYAMYDKYFKTPGCTSTSCTPGSGKSSSNYLLSWYYAWGGDIGGAWSWRIGSSHNHQGYQNPLAAYVLGSSGPTALRPQSPTAATDWDTSLTRQLDFYLWLQSAEGAIAGGATNSWNGNYSAPPAGTPTFYGMAYDVKPVYHDPPSNQWFGFQAWSLHRVAEYYYASGNAKAKAILDKWVAWAIANTTLGSGSNFSIPSDMTWTGQPSGNYSGGSGPAANPGLHVSVTKSGNDVGVAAAYARTLTYYAAKENGSTLGNSAKATAKGLLDRLILLKANDTKGIVVPEVREDYNRFDDVWNSTTQTGLYVPSGFSGMMGTGVPINSSSTFMSIRPFYATDPAWPAVQAYLNGTGPAPTFTYHRFWAQSDIAMAFADFGSLFPTG
ncbi:cellulose 1,4-beta-cellobiosidase [Catellatospora sp. TT07R-123]|uniref:glycoside hydrolase family 48 protein n=1 Tax=Catellatospora sp. TT07R-123 TaxID=2733863 RepID=UPI001B0FA55B|nr:glycoside hydrolase family 48 protein [Catellatospora sp. TT07R-123]GHJ44468.1 cellulose 1,4-beta-cellobiosidase [Catellatospora sp. TT07R-123]